MRTFSIDQTAIARIQLIFSYSEYSEPVAELRESSGGHRFEEFHGAIAETETPEEPSAVATKRVGETREPWMANFRLDVCAAERADCRPETLHDIDGITFSVNPRIVEVLHDYCLTFENKHFWFMDAHGTLYTLLGLLTRKRK